MTVALLKAMQLADTSFPTGGFGFSWGLESAVAAGVVTRLTFDAWLETELLDRWANFDRVILAEAWQRPLDTFADYEAEVDVLFWSEPLRQHSVRAGHAFLVGTQRFGDPAAATLKDMCRKDAAHGHLSPVQGAVFASQRLPLELAIAAAAHGAVQALTSAAVRLSLISALEAQRAYTALQPSLAAVMEAPARGTTPTSFAPLSEMAMLTPPSAPLFMN
ncbi:MAG: urease accessory UreF family protein [Pseudomonadota bacterium]